MNVRIRIIRSPSGFDARNKMNCTICSDGTNKAQLLYHNSIKLVVGSELILKRAEVEIKSMNSFTIKQIK